MSREEVLSPGRPEPPPCRYQAATATSACDYVLVSLVKLYKAAAGTWDPSPATSRCSSLVSRISVTTCGQRKQAAGPSWRNQRHVGRMAQRGNERTTGSSIVAMRVARRQLVPSKWPQPWPMQGAAMRMTSVGAAGPMLPGSPVRQAAPRSNNRRAVRYPACRSSRRTPARRIRPVAHWDREFACRAPRRPWP